MIRRRKTLNSFFYRLLIACLLFSVPFVSMPSWAQTNQQNLMGSKTGEATVMEEANPGNPIGVVTIVMIIWEVVKTAIWPPRWPPTWPPGAGKMKKLKELEESIREEIKKIAEVDLRYIWSYLTDIQEALAEEKQSRKDVDSEEREQIRRLKWLMRNLKTMIEQEIASRKTADAQQAEDIENFKKDVLQIIPEAQVIIPKLKKTLQEAESTIQDMKDKISYIEAMKKELKEEIESRKTMDAEQARKIENLERLREATRKEIETLKTINAWQTKAIKRDRTIIFFLALGIIYAISSSK
ncbi:hypothetical protein ES702_04355 [subsurface metagenome]